MSGAALRLDQVCFGYEPGRRILDSLSLAIPPGRTLALLGANGSGKTTSLKLMSGLLQPQSGRVELYGANLAALSRRAIARQIAVVPQERLETAFFTVRELVMLGRHPWRRRFGAESARDHACVEEALAAVGLEGMAGKPVEALSGGEHQRVRVAMAIAQASQIMLLDEPMTHLDIKHQLEVLDLLTGYGRRLGRTVIMVLHDLNLAAIYADELALLHQGRLLSSGPPAAVLTAENIAAAYGAAAAVVHGAHGRPHVVLRSRPTRQGAPGPRVHVLGGGGAAANLLTDLAVRGFTVSAGPVNQGDLDALVASDLGLETVLLPPASAVDAEAYARGLAAARAAAALVVANAPFGPGNLDNLRLALTCRQSGLPVLLVEEDAIALRDFAGGRAAAIYGALVEAGAIRVPREQMLASCLQEVLGAGGSNGDLPVDPGNRP